MPWLKIHNGCRHEYPALQGLCSAYVGQLVVHAMDMHSEPAELCQQAPHITRPAGPESAVASDERALEAELHLEAGTMHFVS